MANMIRKISVKTTVGDLKKFVMSALKEKTMENGQKFDVFSVVGIVKKVTKGTHDQFGDYYEFGGQFEATALCGDTKNTSYRAAKCFLPEVATDLLVAEYDRVASENDGVVDGIQIALKVIATVDEDAAVLYSFEVQPLIEATEADPLAMIKQQAGLYGIEAPKGE